MNNPNDYVDCPRCGGIPDVDEEGRSYTCFFCHDEGFVLASEAEEDERDRAASAHPPYKRPAPTPPVYDDGSNDIPF